MPIHPARAAAIARTKLTWHGGQHRTTPRCTADAVADAPMHSWVEHNRSTGTRVLLGLKAAVQADGWGALKGHAVMDYVTSIISEASAAGIIWDHTCAEAVGFACDAILADPAQLQEATPFKAARACMLLATRRRSLEVEVVGREILRRSLRHAVERETYLTSQPTLEPEVYEFFFAAIAQFDLPASDPAVHGLVQHFVDMKGTERDWGRGLYDLERVQVDVDTRMDHALKMPVDMISFHAMRCVCMIVIQAKRRRAGDAQILLERVIFALNTVLGCGDSTISAQGVLAYLRAYSPSQWAQLAATIMRAVRSGSRDFVIPSSAIREPLVVIITYLTEPVRLQHVRATVLSTLIVGYQRYYFAPIHGRVMDMAMAINTSCTGEGLSNALLAVAKLKTMLPAGDAAQTEAMDAHATRAVRHLLGLLTRGTYTASTRGCAATPLTGLSGYDLHKILGGIARARLVAPYTELIAGIVELLELRECAVADWAFTLPLLIDEGWTGCPRFPACAEAMVAPAREFAARDPRKLVQLVLSVAALRDVPVDTVSALCDALVAHPVTGSAHEIKQLVAHLRSRSLCHAGVEALHDRLAKQARSGRRVDPPHTAASA